jgi:hypothetical protein
MTERIPFLYPGPRIALLRRIRALTADDLHGLDAAVRMLLAEGRKRADKGYYFAWWDGPRLDREADNELQDLFAACLAALAGGLTGLDVEGVAARFAPKKSAFGGLAELIAPTRPGLQVQHASIELIDTAVAPWDPRLAIVAIWNMACAAALRDILPAATMATLQEPWRRALGDPPI